MSQENTQNKIATFSSYDPQAWGQMEKMAQTFIKSKALPSGIDSAEKLIVIFQAGRDFGLSATEAINGFYFVNGKLTIWGPVALSQVTKSGFKVEWKECDEKSATVKISREDRGDITETFTIEDATKAGLNNKDIWKKYPKNMLKWKAFGNAVKFFCPEALHGFYLKEEMEGVEEEQGSNFTGEVNVVVEDQDFQDSMKIISEANDETTLKLAKQVLQNKIWSPTQYRELAQAWMDRKREVEAMNQPKPEDKKEGNVIDGEEIKPNDKEKIEKRAKLLCEAGLVFNGQSFTMQDIEVAHYEVLTLNDEQFDAIIEVAKQRKANPLKPQEPQFDLSGKAQPDDLHGKPAETAALPLNETENGTK